MAAARPPTGSLSRVNPLRRLSVCPYEVVDSKRKQVRIVALRRVPAGIFKTS
jgi:hypothetical protein